uniref:molybdate ABC transporter permease subunit n=1 Tax=Thaumasiovibrio occultus TaxID=1891184 RepID=UPI000B35B7ED|nr:molybdate ABC transporter permease subunit [Thaumasiovibrio occultus]
MFLTDFERTAIGLSLKVGIAAVLVTLPVALVLAWLLSRHQFRGKSLLASLIHLPLVMPPVVIGYVLLLTFGRQSPLGQWLDSVGLSFSFNWKGAVLASAVVALPLMVRALRTGFDVIDPKLELAARTLGASRMRTFRTITLPLLAPSVGSGLLLGFSRALGEFGATITFVANIPGQTQTIPLAIFQSLELPNGEWQALRLCVVSIAICFFAVGLSEYWQKVQRER